MSEIIITMVCNVAMLVLGALVGADWRERQDEPGSRIEQGLQHGRSKG